MLIQYARAQNSFKYVGPNIHFDNMHTTMIFWWKIMEKTEYEQYKGIVG